MNLKEFVQRRRYALAIIIALLFVLFIGLYVAFSPTEFGKKIGGINTAGQKNINNTPAEKVDKNQIKGDVIILSDGTKIQIPDKTASASSTTIQTGGSGSSGQPTGSSGTGLGPGSQPGSNPSIPTSPPSPGVFKLGRDETYPDQQIEVPKNNFLLAKFNLFNEKDGQVDLSKLYLDFAFTDDFSREDLGNVYIVIAGKKYSTIAKVGNNQLDWSLNQNMIKGNSVKVEVYSDISSQAVSSNVIPDEIISIVKVRGVFNGLDIWSGPNETDQYVPGQVMLAKSGNIIGGLPNLQIPSTSSTPPLQPNQPAQPTTSTSPITPSPEGILITAFNNSTPNSHQALTGSTEDILSIDVTAENEDIYITAVEFKYDGQFAEVEKFTLYGAPDSVSLSNLIGPAKQVPIGNKVNWQWHIVDNNILKIRQGKTAILSLKVKYALKNGVHSLTGTKLNFELSSLTGRGAVSTKDIIAKTNNIKSKTVMLVETKPIITLTSKGGNISGGTQEILEFKIAAEKNDNNSGLDKVYLDYIDIYTPVVKNVSVKNVSLEPKYVPFDPSNIYRCVGLKPYQWRCNFSTNDLRNEIMEGLSTSYVIKAEVGLNGNGEFNVKATTVEQLNNYFGGVDFSGALSWNNFGIGSSMLTWVDGGARLSANWTGSGIGALYDGTGPKIVSYKATNGGIAGQIDSGDKIEITFDEIIAPYSFISNLYPGGDAISVRAGANGSLSHGQTIDANSIDANMASITGIGLFNQNGITNQGVNPGKFSTKVWLDNTGKILTIQLDNGAAAQLQSPVFVDDGKIADNNAVRDMNNNSMPVITIPYSANMNF